MQFKDETAAAQWEQFAAVNSTDNASGGVLNPAIVTIGSSE